MTSEAEEEVVLVYKQGVEVPENVTTIIFDASVTEIPDGTFRQGVFTNCKQLKEVILNEGLQRIGYYAFCGCRSLAIIKLPSTISEIDDGAFKNCTNLREVVLNEGLQLIDFQAFYKCTSLTIIKFPTTVIEIGESAFAKCTNLKEVVLNEGLQEIPSAFHGCTSLERINLPSTITEVGAHAFSSCTNLKEVILNECLQKIGNNAFSYCTSLERIKLPSTVTEVGYCAFYSCTNLREVVLNEGLQQIERAAFNGCESLQCVNFPSISKRAKNLIEAGQTEVEDKITIYQHFEWRGDEFSVSLEAIRNGNWADVRVNLKQLLAWISHYELKEATTLYELALWKARIEETGAVMDEERSAFRVDVPGPAKDAILQFLQQTSND